MLPMNGSGMINSKEQGVFAPENPETLVDCPGSAHPVSPSEADAPSVLPVLSDEGFIIEPFGQDTWCVRGSGGPRKI